MTLKEVSKGCWDKIFYHYKIPITNGNRHYSGQCPVCKKKGKFRLFKDWIHTGNYICVCGSGSGITLIMNVTQKPYEEIAKEIYSMLGYNQTTKKSSKNRENKSLNIMSEFNEYQFLDYNQGYEYLINRGITILPHKFVRYVPLKKFDKYNSYSAIYALMTDSNFNPVFGHATFLIGDKKLDHPNAKKMYRLNDSYENSLSVKMFEYKDTLGIAEGIETALSGVHMFNVPVWSTLNSNYMKKFNAPKGVIKLMIFADNDSNGTGLEAAFICGRNNILMPNDVIEVVILWPKERGDFNDILTSKINNNVIQWKLDKN